MKHYKIRFVSSNIRANTRIVALWLRIDQEPSKLNISVSNRQIFKEFYMNTINVCWYLLTMIFLDFSFPNFFETKTYFFLEIFLFEKKIKFSNFHSRETSLPSKLCAHCRSLINSFTHTYILFLFRVKR